MDDDTMMIGCSCAGCCTILRFHRIQWPNDPAEVIVDAYISEMGAGSLRWRLRKAWRVLRGQDDWNHCLIFEEAQMRELHSYASRVLDGMREHASSHAQIGSNKSL